MTAASLRVPLLWAMTLALAACSRQPVSQDIVGPELAAKDTSLLQALALSPVVADGQVAAAPPRQAMSLLNAAPAFLAHPRSQDDATRAADCLTAAVYYEARSEPLDGQRAVAQVVLNRVRDRAFPASVCGVVYQGGARRDGRGIGCQFSFACDGSTSRPVDGAAWQRARGVAEAALAGAVYAPIGAATYYHTDAVHPWWAPSLARVGQIGAHIFYGWRSAMAAALSFRRDYAGVEPVSMPLLAATTAPAPVAMAAETAGVTVHRGIALPSPPATDASGDVVADASAEVAVTMGVRVHRRHGASAASMIVAIGPEEGPGDDRS